MIFFLLAACSTTDEQACIDSCEDTQSFWEVCFDSIQAAGLYVDCYSELDGLGESLAEAGSDSSARLEVYELWRDQGYIAHCETASDVVDNCVNRITAEFSYMSSEAAAERGQECREEDTSVIGEAIRNLDCQGFITALGGQPPSDKMGERRITFEMLHKTKSIMHGPIHAS